MKVNVGTPDRALRVVAGIALIGLAAGVTEFDMQLRDANDGVVHVKIQKPAK